MGVLTVYVGRNEYQEAAQLQGGGAGICTSAAHPIPATCVPGLWWAPVCTATQNDLRIGLGLHRYSDSSVDPGLWEVEYGLGESSGFGTRQTQILALWLQSCWP